jgi:hypothetical protein
MAFPCVKALQPMRFAEIAYDGTRPTRAREKAVGRSAFGVQLAARHSFESPLRTHTAGSATFQHRDHLAGLAALARRTGVRGGLGRFFARAALVLAGAISDATSGVCDTRGVAGAASPKLAQPASELSRTRASACGHLLGAADRIIANDISN